MGNDEKKIEQLASTWEQFKALNDRRIAEIEKKGHADPITLAQLNKLNNALDGYRNEGVFSTEASVLNFSEPYNPAMSEYKAAFCHYLREGVDSELVLLEKKAFSNGGGDDGGFLVTNYILDTLTRIVAESSPMRQIAAVTKTSTGSLQMLEDNSSVVVGWAASETDTEDKKPSVGKKTIHAHELVAQPKATLKLLRDASIDVEYWLVHHVADVFLRTENTTFIAGDGIAKPKGILNYRHGHSWGQIEQISSGTSAQITSDSIIELYYALKEEYSTRATFLMNRSTAQHVRLLKESTTDQYLWQPGLSAGAPDTLLGVPVMQASDMPEIAGGNLPIAIGDFSRAYQIVDKTGVRVLRDPYTEKPFIKFYTSKYVGGDVTNFEAIKLLKVNC